MWTTCPRCRGTRYEPVALPADQRGTGEPELGDPDDECRLCLGDGGVYEDDDEDDPRALDDVDVQDED